MSKSSNNSRLVYATDQGRIKPDKDRPQNASDGDGIVRIARETKGRKGKGVSLVSGIPCDQLKNIAKSLKQKLGIGGAVKNGVIEIQTDDRTKIKQLLETQGFTVKISGG